MHPQFVVSDASIDLFEVLPDTFSHDRERSYLRVTDRRSGHVLHEGGPEPTRPTASKRLAEATGRSVSAVVAEAVERHVTTERRRLAAERINALIGTVEGAPDADNVLLEMRRTSDRELS